MKTLVVSGCLVAVVAVAGCGNAAPQTAGAPASDSPTADVRPTQEPAEQPSDRAAKPPGPSQGARLAPLDGPKPDVRWTPNGFEVRAFGSSSCPPVARAVEVVDPSTVLIDVTPASAGACTDDLVGHNSFIAAPRGLDEDRVLQVQLRDRSGVGVVRAIEIRFMDNTAM